MGRLSPGYVLWHMLNSLSLSKRSPVNRQPSICDVLVICFFSLFGGCMKCSPELIFVFCDTLVTFQSSAATFHLVSFILLTVPCKLFMLNMQKLEYFRKWCYIQARSCFPYVCWISAYLLLSPGAHPLAWEMLHRHSMETGCVHLHASARTFSQSRGIKTQLAGKLNRA